MTSLTPYPAGCLIFDLDGTLVDSVPDLTSCLNRLLASRNLPPVTAGQVVKMVGDGAGALLSRAFGAQGAVPDVGAMADFLADYEVHTADRSVAYPGVMEGLRALADEGYVMGVCTNKPETPARRALEELGMAEFFQAVAGGDSFPIRKPDPGHLLGTIKLAGGVARDAVMIGDHVNDIAAAVGAKVPAIFAEWGYGSADMAEGAAFRAAGFGEVPGLVRKILKG